MDRPNQPVLFKTMKTQKGLKVRASKTMTEGAFWAMIRSLLRRRSSQWKPIKDALLKAQRPSESSNPRLKWEYQCAYCMDWHPKTGVEVEHTVEVGSLTKGEDLPLFVERLFCESDHLLVLCLKCHDIKTYKR